MIPLRIRLYVPHLQIFILMAEFTSSSPGSGFLDKNAAAVMICPDWQYPHWGTSSAIQAFCSGWLEFSDKPSMVVIFKPSAFSMGVIQDRVSSPSMWIVHAPHRPLPHPNLVPVNFNSSRITQRSGVSPSMVMPFLSPFIFITYFFLILLIRH